MGRRQKPGLYLTVGMALTAMSTQGVLYSLVAYLVASGMQSETAVIVLSGNSLLSAPALLAAGILADHWRPERILGVALAVQSAHLLRCSLRGYSARAAAMPLYSVFTAQCV